MAPGLVPSPRRLGGRRLLLASLTERGNSVDGARPRAVAPFTKCSRWRRWQYPPGIFFNDPLSDRTNARCFHGGKPRQCNLGVFVLWMVHDVHLCMSIYYCVSIRYISTLFFGCPSCPSGLHPGESIRARRQALPLTVADASTPSAWNGMIHSLLPAGVYGGARPVAWGRWRLGCVPPVVSSLISGSLGPSGATITVRRPAS